MYQCNSCGATYKKAQFGSCKNCGAFQDFREVPSGGLPSRGGKKSVSSTAHGVEGFARAVPISSVKPEDFSARLSSGFAECDRVLGGGFVPGEVALLAGTPGAGKSTLSLAVANNIATSTGRKVVYVSGEESVDQIALRAKRMGVVSDNIIVAHETRAEAVVAYCLEYSPVLCVVDSVQTLSVESVTSAAGSIAQSKAVTDSLTLFGKQNNIVMVLISQVVKSGDFSGSKSNQHIVDVTMNLDLDTTSPLRFLRCDKNRFGSTDEVGVFQHVDSGLEEITDPTKIALDGDGVQGSSGTAISMLSEGARFFPVEIQALAIPSALNNPRKQFAGVLSNRAHGICAIIDKFCKTDLAEQDTYLNTVAGISIHSPSCDLGVAVALMTSIKSLDMPAGFCYLGEVSLTGAVRNSGTITRAAVEAYRLGYNHLVIPASAKPDIVKQLKSQGVTSNDVTMYPVKTIADVFKVITSKGSKNSEESELADKAKKISNAKKYYKNKSKNDNE